MQSTGSRVKKTCLDGCVDLDASHVVCNTNTPESTCNEVTSYDDTCQLSSGGLVEIRGHKDNMEGKYQIILWCHSLMPVTPTFQTLS